MVDCMICHGGDKMDYESIFRKKQHYITIPQIPTKKLFIGNRQVNRILNNQEDNQDIYITKYAKDDCVSTVILDFDDKENPDNALKDATILKKYLHRKGLNTVIVRSGRKGYHVYIQIPVHNFIGGELAHANFEPNVWFKQYVKQLIGLYDGKYYQTLDDVNFSAGLKGNIRLIGSQHPKGTRCEILFGEFERDIEPNDWDDECFEVSKRFAEDDARKIFETKKLKYKGDDLIADNNLIDIFEQELGASVKRYNGYAYANCIFHNDAHKSLYINKEKFSCNACGCKGNIWTLIKNKLITIDDSVRIGR